MVSKQIVKIATRKSPLALWQAEYFKAQLLAHYPDLIVELVTFVTKGDVILDTPLAKVGGKGLFVKELENALLNGEADIAVHSMKDVPAEFPEGLKLAVICERDTPYDAFVSNNYEELNQLPLGAVVGTSSLRRQAQLKKIRPDLQMKDLRGNVGTRLSKLDAGEYDAIILAAAGLKRLGLTSRIKHSIEAEQLLPAVGQGAVGIECRENDTRIIELLAPLNHLPTAACVLAERAMNTVLQGGCQVPIAGFAQLNGSELKIVGRVGALDGSRFIESNVVGNISDAENLGQQLANQLLNLGAREILTGITF